MNHEKDNLAGKDLGISIFSPEEFSLLELSGDKQTVGQWFDGEVPNVGSKLELVLQKKTESADGTVSVQVVLREIKPGILTMREDSIKGLVGKTLSQLDGIR
ncbi:hypothetical protein [Serratia sp. M24T3]|uniref:hypothetical protein n=1 Tax=Serratia sp. M24T3 TaxID=932213 RepID=UPI00025BA80C|nr:hypothetical protein [Serratia sp. M24T3]EIC82168.1 hypothetical protein SPM24T3_23332 [Serratia sp. M24T3]